MPPSMQTWAQLAAPILLVSAAGVWYNVVSRDVPEPYLDEFFHVPQAQKYCRGDYSWDPKITTPPGLYLVAKLFEPLFGCSTSALRWLNSVALCMVCPLSYWILRMKRTPVKQAQQDSKKGRAVERLQTNDQTLVLDAHSALNIALFPPLFFFSALFYTDVMSTLTSLLAYSVFLRKKTTPGSLFDNVSAILVGVVALFFRQTNIFWVAVFPAGLAVVEALKTSESLSRVQAQRSALEIIQESWSRSIIYDCPVEDAGIEDAILLLLTTTLTAVRNPLRVLKATFPYIVLLGLFASFVIWNGSVVLGDKSAHTATVHTPQMLYIWPYIALFSAPLMIGPLLRLIKIALPRQIRSCISESFIASGSGMPTVLLLVIFICGGLVAVHFNTIVHPYTLADNRHYVFYVFKILRRYPILKYLAVPVYYSCAWLAVQALASPTIGQHGSKQRREATPTSTTGPQQPCQISFIVIWLATTALSVITAPLVEPRYFIIPWIVWRLYVPYHPASLSKDRSNAHSSYDMRLVLETLWLLAVNAALSYNFLYRTFTWPSEPGSLQRFLW